MKLKKILSLILVAVMLCVSAYAATVYDCISIGGVETEATGGVAISGATAMPENYAAYGLGTVTQYTEAQAEAANVPAGYDGDVYVVEPIEGSLGIDLDFSGANIPAASLKSITLKFYPVHDTTSSGKSQLYIPKPSGGWRMAYPLENNFGTDKWVEFTIGDEYGWRTSEGFVNHTEFVDADGMMNKINLMFTNLSLLYVDSVKVEYYPMTIKDTMDTDATPNAVVPTSIKKYPYIGDDDRAVPNNIYESFAYGIYTSGYEGLEAPKGYEGTVWEFGATGNVAGIVVDFSSMKIDYTEVENITLRLAIKGEAFGGIHIPALTYDSSKAWWAYNLGQNTDQLGDMKSQLAETGWCDFVIDPTSFRSGYGFVHLTDNAKYTNVEDRNDDLYLLNLRVSGTKLEKVYLDNITIQLRGGKTIDGEMLGAQVRTTGEKGLRFGTRIATNGNFNLDDVQFVSQDDKLYAGTLVVAKADLAAAGLEANELTHANMKAAEAVDVKAANIYDSAYNTTSALYTAVVYDIPDDTAEIVARGYIRYTADNGITYKYFYFDPVTKSVDAVKDASGWAE